MKDGMNYAPTGKPDPVCKSGGFLVGVIGLDHGHINGMCNGLVEAGAVVRLVYDDDTLRATAFAERYPGASVATSMEQVFEDPSIHLIASAAIPPSPPIPGWLASSRLTGLPLMALASGGMGGW